MGPLFEALGSNCLDFVFFLNIFCYGFNKRPQLTTDVPGTTLSPFGFWRGRINHTRTHHICILRVLCLHFSVFALVGIWFCALMSIYYASLILKLCWRWGCGMSHERNEDTNCYFELSSQLMGCKADNAYLVRVIVFALDLTRWLYFVSFFEYDCRVSYGAVDTGDSCGSVGHLSSAHQRRTCGPAATPCSNKCSRFCSRLVVFLLDLALSCYCLFSWLNNWGRAKVLRESMPENGMRDWLWVSRPAHAIYLLLCKW